MNKKILLVVIILGVLAGIYFLMNANPNNRFPNDPVPPEFPEDKPTSNSTNTTQFGKSVELKLNGRAIFSDGLKVILTEINDSRCKPNVQCFWQGELAVVLEVSSGKLSIPGEVHLGTELTKTAKVEDYTFTLQSADEKSATILVGYQKS